MVQCLSIKQRTLFFHIVKEDGNIFWRLACVRSKVLSQQRFETFRCSQDTESCIVTRRTFGWTSASTKNTASMHFFQVFASKVIPKQYPCVSPLKQSPNPGTNFKQTWLRIRCRRMLGTPATVS